MIGVAVSERTLGPQSLEWIGQALLEHVMAELKKQLQIVLLSVLFLLPAAHAWAQAYDAAGQRELYHAEVCNQGRIKVLVAVAYKDFGVTDEFWIIDYWHRVEPGKCTLVFSHFYAPNNWLSFQSFPLHLAFVFTDSTGVTGSAKVRPPQGVAASRVQLCVGVQNYKYRVNGTTPEVKCPKAKLIPASIDWEPTRGVYPNAYSKEYPPPTRFTVALGPNDRAIPWGSQASPSVTPQGPDTSDAFRKLLSSAMSALSVAEQPLGPTGQYQLKPGYRWVFACADRSVVSKDSWSDIQTSRAKTVTNAVRTFLESHGKGTIRFRVRALNEALSVEQIGGKTGDCLDRGEYEFVFQSPEVGAAIGAAPTPAPKAAPEPAPGFGDLMPGGIITPLPPLPRK